MLVTLGIVLGLWLLWGLGVFAWSWFFQEEAYMSDDEVQAMDFLERLGDHVGELADGLVRFVFALTVMLQLLPILTLLYKVSRWLRRGL